MQAAAADRWRHDIAWQAVYLRGVQVILVGIDPGTTTGLAVWWVEERKLMEVGAYKLHHAMDEIRATSLGNNSGTWLVVFEDCRKHRVFGRAQRNDAALQGVGSVKRDCAIWDDFLTDLGIPFITRAPSRRRTKLTAKQFAAATGWTERSNNHGRDAAMLVAGTTETTARAWLAEAQQRGAK